MGFMIINNEEEAREAIKRLKGNKESATMAAAAFHHYFTSNNLIAKHWFIDHVPKEISLRAYNAYKMALHRYRIPKKTGKSKKVEYGQPIDFRGLRHAPINEQGVVYLFGMLSQELGFNIEAVRKDFPDCEGKRRISGKQGRWERVFIEFEYKSSNFREHAHNPNECNIIVCWEHDWKECPIEVISLKEVVKKDHKMGGT